MMARAGRFHLIRAALILVLLFGSGVAAIKVRHDVVQQQYHTRAVGLVDALINADTRQVPEIVRQLDQYKTWAEPLLAERLAQAPDGSTERLHLSLASVARDDRQVEYLYGQLLGADPNRFPVIRDALSEYRQRISDRLWSVVAGRDSDPDQRRLRAAGALAAYDPQNPAWTDVTAEVASQLVTVNPAFVGQWQEALRPVSQQLLSPLAKIFTDPEQGELARSLATTLLTDYAKDDAARLTSLLVDADAKGFASLFPVLQQHQQAAVKELRAVVEHQLEIPWNDPPLDPAWKEPSAEVRRAIEAAEGMVAERFAFCTSLPWDDFFQLVESLRASGYRPTRVRPYRGPSSPAEKADAATEPATLVAAVWTRDGKRWALDSDLTADQLPSPESPAEKDGLVPADVAVLPDTEASGDPRFLLLWSAPTGAQEQRRIVVDVSEQEMRAAEESLVKESFASQWSIAVWSDSNRTRHYAGIWSNQGARSELTAAHSGFERLDQPQWDVAVAPASKLADPLDLARQRLEQIGKLPIEQQDQAQVRFGRAWARYQLGQFEPALADLDFLVANKGPATVLSEYRALTLARLGRADEARAESATYVEQQSDATMQSYVRIVLAASLGDFEDAAAQLDPAATLAGENPGDLYNIGCAAALAGQACGEADEALARKFTQQALELLETAVGYGYRDAGRIRTDVDLAGLHAEPRFVALVEGMEPPARYAGVWREEATFESALQTSDGSPVDRARQLSAEGYRPVAIAVDAHTEGSVRCSLVWHRPLLPDADKEQLAQRQASAGAALLRMAETGPVWLLLQQHPDPRLRTWLIHRLGPLGVDAELLAKRLLEEPDASIRQALILSLGQYTPDRSLGPPAGLAFLSATLLELYRDDPDPGIHGATGWLLRRWGYGGEVRQIDRDLATGKIEGDRRWFVNKQGQTLVVIPGPVEFLMGSPAGERDRGADEILHRCRIERSYAIGSTEVTVAQYKRFQADFVHTVMHRSPEGDCPVLGVTWYEAVEYCNWLSGEEGLPENQWCYVPNAQGRYAEGMQLASDWLSRQGYRLPTEVEWEYASRAGTVTSYGFGESRELLGRYAWYLDNSQERSWPVGSLLPNALGLFDMHGNVLNWCQDWYRGYARTGLRLDDGTSAIGAGSRRVGRGGSWDDGPVHCRSAFRGRFSSGLRFNILGFRPARSSVE
jgi:formylglycine-generating enzyme required for sulfatase activity/tetratricopeptide (TPR) repeat protein